jgi:hypothetical protein
MIAGHGSFLGCFIERKVPDVFISQYRTRVDTYQSVFFKKKQVRRRKRCRKKR